ncbi:Mini-ribonuclease 3 [Caldisalinibacter kiritimatiensis]|uniref:Mini-ribonuclease 3 n=1 Tax=Caldisalinibacter kiritimatiensis TaxID=1304284 RepID=R1ASG0_9FIRM|nr:ribonuclease III domain-containing protein [Caldisalinibacter kiritimatiensis]EOD00078.1 Ribonuclease III family protein [Caldisalinibacter kiritimatiensis]
MEESLGENMADKLFDRLKAMIQEKDIRAVKMMSPLHLAYIGDAVYEVLVRTYLVNNKETSVNQLHREAVKYVKAESQADIVHYLEEYLNEEEWSIVKRGRNAKSGSVPKNANLIDYKYATGFEALIGFLYLTGRYEKLLDIFELILNKIKEDQ